MSCYAGPYNRGIVTNGLVLYYDVNEPVCYSSGRTDIQDLSRNGNAGTLVNGVGYSANNGGSLVFDGVNDYVNLGTTFSSYISSSLPATWESLVYLNQTNNNEAIIGTSWANGGVHVRKTGSSHPPANRIRCIYFTNGSNGTGVDSSNVFGNGIYHVSFVYNGAGLSYSNFKLYINGILSSTTNPTSGSPTTVPTTQNLNIGGIAAESAAYWSGKIFCSRVYNRALSETEIQQNYNSTKDRFIQFNGLSSSTPAPSASYLRSIGTTTNGAYWYIFNDGQVRQLWTDFTTYAPYSFVMVNRIWSGSQNQYLTTEENVSQLATTPASSPPTSNSKLSDVHMNDIISSGTIRWVIIGNGSTFYRIDDNPQWYSNHGTAVSCSYDRGFYDGIATPSSSPSWITSGFTYQACGGIYISSAWGSLSGIHVNDNTYFGGYSGGWAGRASPPAPYDGLGGGNNSWSQNGYVFLSW